MSADNNRRIENLIRYGVIAEVNHQKRRARVQTGEILTDWLPWCAMRAGTTKIWSPITVGEQCVIFSPSAELHTGFILVGIYTVEFDTPSHSPDEHVIEFADGAKIEYNQNTSSLKITGISTALVEASTSVTLQTPTVNCTNDLNVANNVSVGGTVTSGGDMLAGGISQQHHKHPGGVITGEPM